MKARTLKLLVATAAFAFTLAACSSDEPGDQAVAITFRPQVGNAAFSCTTTYTDIGTTASDVEFTDFKLYVSDVRLVTSRGGGAGGTGTGWRMATGQCGPARLRQRHRKLRRVDRDELPGEGHGAGRHVHRHQVHHGHSVRAQPWRRGNGRRPAQLDRHVLGLELRLQVPAGGPEHHRSAGRVLPARRQHGVQRRHGDTSPPTSCDRAQSRPRSP